MKKVEKDSFISWPLIGGLTKVGNHMIVTKTTLDKESNSYFKDLCFINEDMSLTPLTSDHKVGGFKKESDTSILFVANRLKEDEPKKDEKKTVYYRLPLTGGEAYKAYEFNLDVLDFEIRGQKAICLIAENVREEDHKEDDYVILHEVPFVANGQGFIDSNRTALVIYDLETKEMKRITEKFFDVHDYKVIGNKVYYKGVYWEDINPHYAGLWVYDLESDTTSSIIEDGKYYIGKFTGNEKELIILMSEGLTYGVEEHPDFYAYHLETKKLTKIASYDNPTYGSLATDCNADRGDSLQCFTDGWYFVGLDGYQANIYKLEDGLKKVLTFNGSIGSYFIDGGKIYVCGMKPGKLSDVYVYENGVEIKKTNVSCILDDYKIQEVQYTPFINRRNESVDGWIIYPCDYEEGKKYPGILDIHGGPRGAYGEVLYHEMQLWANEGYFVFFCNPYGSDGKGNAFSDMRLKYGTIDYEDIMDFVDHIIATNPDLDANRLGVTGGSYGGYMTNWIITHTNRFKAAVTQRSISNWVSDYGTSGISYNDPLHGGAQPWTDLETMWQSSPLKYAANCTTPTLFIHSFEDYTCAISQAYELFTALKMLGVETRACLFKGENHSLSRIGKPLHRVKRLEEITNWMNAHLK